MGHKRTRLAHARKNVGLSQEALAERLGVDRSTVARWESGETEPLAWIRPKLARTLGVTPGVLGEVFSVPADDPRHLAVTEAVNHPGHADSAHSSWGAADPEGIDALVAAIGGSQTSQHAIEQLDTAATALAESHTQAPARRLLTEVLALHRQAQHLLTCQQRLSQRRELFRIESSLLAHACLLFGDLNQNLIAERYGQAALVFAQESGATEAFARTALAKTLRWARRLIESAEMAARGYQRSPNAPVKVQLASQEANAAALLGDSRRAAEALARSADAAEQVSADSAVSAWSFPTGRQAIFGLSVATETGNPRAALAAAASADAGWAAGQPMVTANWAQIRIGAGIAHLVNGSLDATLAEVTPVLTLAPDRRVATVTGYTDSLLRRLQHPTLKGNKTAAALRHNIIDFNTHALPDDQPPAR